MSATTQERPMTKPKGRPKKPGGEGRQVRIAPDLVAKGHYIATERGISLGELFSEMLRPAVEREFKRIGRELMGGDG